MHQHVGQRLRHAPNYSASLQPAPVTATTSWGDAPGYKTASLQPAAQGRIAMPCPHIIL
jgi:hypothetical protein